MAATDTYTVTWNEDGDATVLGRVTASDATGDATGKAGEGYFIKQADLSTVTCSVFDLSSTTPNTAFATPTVTIASDVLDTVVTTNVLWTVDIFGYNFQHDLAASNFPTGGHIYLVEYKFTTSGGKVIPARFQGPAKALRTS